MFWLSKVVAKPHVSSAIHAVQFFNFGWEDMTTPTLPLMLDIVKVMASVLQDGHQKVWGLWIRSSDVDESTHQFKC